MSGSAERRHRRAAEKARARSSNVATAEAKARARATGRAGKRLSFGGLEPALGLAFDQLALVFSQRDQLDGLKPELTRVLTPLFEVIEGFDLGGLDPIARGGIVELARVVTQLGDALDQLDQPARIVRGIDQLELTCGQLAQAMGREPGFRLSVVGLRAG